jgi:hypothetical protein
MPEVKPKPGAGAFFDGESRSRLGTAIQGRTTTECCELIMDQQGIGLLFFQSGRKGVSFLTPFATIW